MGLEAQKHVGMRFITVSVSQLTEYLQVTGTVQPIDSKVGNIRPLARGRIQDVLVQVGSRVHSGQPLANFDNIEAGELASQHESARAELQRLKVQWAAVSRQVDRNRQLSQIGAIPTKDYEASQAEQQALAESIKARESVVAGIATRLHRFGLEVWGARPTTLTVIRAPFAGVVTKVQVSAGEVVDPEMVLFSVADLTRVWVQAEVYEKDLGRIQLGQNALVTVDTYPGERFPGRVTYMSDFLDPQTRTVRVRCEVPNGDWRLKLDMFVLVKLPTKFTRQGIAIPSGAIQELEGTDVVFVRKGQTKFEIRSVQPGKVIDGRTEIISGLREGEAIVAQGAFHLKSVALGKELAEEE
jgi:cobalt-zinc-cadmium efflux system membrane fusion protein